MNIVVKKQYLHIGTMAQRVIHTVIDHTPIPKPTRVRIKNCVNCASRVTYLNNLIPKP